MPPNVDGTRRIAGVRRHRNGAVIWCDAGEHEITLRWVIDVEGSDGTFRARVVVTPEQLLDFPALDLHCRIIRVGGNEP